MREKLKHFCMLPLYKVEVEKVINPDKSCHQVYWEWICRPDGKKNESPPICTLGVAAKQQQIGSWKLFVDVISTDKFVKSYEAGESDEAWNKLLVAAEAKGFKVTASKVDQQIEKTSCIIDLQNGTLKILAKKVATDDGWSPDIKFIYTDKDDLIKTSFQVSLDSVKNLTDIAEVFTGLAEKFI
jgi:hypothetical protein